MSPILYNICFEVLIRPFDKSLSEIYEYCNLCEKTLCCIVGLMLVASSEHRLIEIKEHIKYYETASGAKIGHSKSLIVKVILSGLQNLYKIISNRTGNMKRKATWLNTKAKH